LFAYEGGALVNGRRVSLRFTDDIDLMEETVSEVQDRQAVHQSSQRHGLEISKGKTKDLLVARETRKEILVVISRNARMLEQGSHFKCLGNEIAEPYKSSTDLQCRTAMLRCSTEMQPAT
jgi:hypothetical protein